MTETNTRQRIAIIGSGISGLTAAHLLHQKHEITVFEKNPTIGGHTATIDINYNGKQFAIDTGFIVYNDRTYPNFIKLLNSLNVTQIKTEMSFSVNCKSSGLEYNGSDLNTLFAQRRNIASLKFWRMLADIVTFNRQSLSDLKYSAINASMTLGEYIQKLKLSNQFTHHYILPMGSAIWSSSLDDMLKFPALFFIRFFKNHGLLSISNRPQWYVLEGGSRSYIEPLISKFKHRILTSTNIRSVCRSMKGIEITFADRETQSFDQVIFACHSDEALALLNDADSSERNVLSALPFTSNDVTLHTDHSLLPSRKKAWASWNYQLGNDTAIPPVLSYNMNILQKLDSETTFLVSLNAIDHIDPSKVLKTFNYSHPIFSLRGIEAQHNWDLINGKRNTWFCGAYWHNGFHEDGCHSGIRVAKALGASW